MRFELTQRVHKSIQGAVGGAQESGVSLYGARPSGKSPCIIACIYRATKSVVSASTNTHAAYCNTNALIWYRVRKIQQVAVLMASESLCSAVPQHQLSPKLSGQDGSEIELLKSQVAELEKKIDENRNEVRQLMAKLETLQRTIVQQVEPLQNEIQPQVSLYKQTVL